MHQRIVRATLDENPLGFGPDSGAGSEQKEKEHSER